MPIPIFIGGQRIGGYDDLLRYSARALPVQTRSLTSP